MKHPRCPMGTTAPEGVSRLAATSTASAETGNDTGGVYVFRVVGDAVYLTFGKTGAVVAPTSSNGFPLTEADGPVCFEVPVGSRFRAICADTETATVAWYRGGER